MNIQSIPINDITPYRDNPRKNTKTIESIMHSLKLWGWQQPIVVDTDMVIVVGHTRYQAAQELGYSEVPVMVAELSKDQAKAYRIMDNKSHDYTRWDFDELQSELDTVLDLDNTGFTVKELDDILYPADRKLGPGGSHKEATHRVIIECQSMDELLAKEQDYVNRGFKCKISYY